MQISPSIISTVEETEIITEKKVNLIKNEPDNFHIWNKNSTENIFAGFNSAQTKKRSVIRPVMLCVKYNNELVYDISDTSDNEFIIIDENMPVSFNELTSAVKESMRIEKVVIQILEKNENLLKSKIFITTKDKNFYISKKRLLGEILKTQRKIERIRPLIMLSVQLPLENQIKKLCTLKVIADKMYSDEPSIFITT
ncbi:hypothetical protein NEPAR06_1865 [Nematocida parisii]|uniref:Uncharacterized protein n=1 Tax=Nematocida parisii (strain ERTm3) TaxID=935791 RepID=I3EGU5_NEMP3|nr:uncharacterized protein NEPG_00218 [Nematocida parisii ERTm1]EIJ88442.1 hypothetical protein NEQG_01132 [Nematocida parisii ERTm3]KAI5146068.1 hypothetical protein NEPAR07_2079 [Nematocida parisii]EIJ94695.1 hypothetical protein NEPG_00218 [Nematocida parisii ERTm1]KAI5155479.1 hypothetical protein NEPAR06_1865 [Nematocida parisii]KAI5158588.1 hypothetical protein NEPAR05_2119 [Nematocida parisii]|eukprot:XP_013058051.1 hypothetical protein NEPG_00218 [Nematocida parisii ERTm1]